MDKKALLQYLTCPLTKLIFCDPVIAEDGYIYEETAINNHLLKNNTSPITGDKMGNIIIKSVNIKRMVSEFLILYPEYKSGQFLFRKPYYLFQNEFIDLIKSREYEKIKEFTNIILNTDILNDTLFEVICKSCPDEVIKYIIDNSIDCDTYNTKRKIKPIHTACAMASLDIINHLVDKNIDLECDDANGERPLGYLLLYRLSEKENVFNTIRKKLFDLDVYINYMNNFGIMPIHYLINYGDIDNVKMFIDNGLSLSYINPKFKLNVVEYAFINCPSFDLIDFLIDKSTNYDLNEYMYVLSNEQLIYNNKYLDIKQKQKLILKYLNRILNKPVVVDNFIDNLNK